MKKYSFLSVIVSTTIFLYACYGSAQLENTNINLTEQKSDVLLFDSVFDALEILPLENDIKCLIKSPKRVLYYDDKYYILEIANNPRVMIFNKDGSYNGSVGVQGKGNGEYTSLHDFTIDEERKRIILLCENSTVFIYDLNGKFIEKKKLSESLLWNIASHKNGFLFTTNHLTFLTGENAYLFYRFDKDFHFVDKDTHVLPEQIYMPSSVFSMLQANAGKVTYCDAFTKKFYIFDENQEVNSQYNYLFSNPMPYEYYGKQELFLTNMQKYDYICDNIATNDRIITFYINQGTPYIAMSDLNGQVILNGQYLGVIPKLCLAKGDEIVSLLSPNEMEMFIKDNKIANVDTVNMIRNNAYILQFKIKNS